MIESDSGSSLPVKYFVLIFSFVKPPYLLKKNDDGKLIEQSSIHSCYDSVEIMSRLTGIRPEVNAVTVRLSAVACHCSERKRDKFNSRDVTLYHLVNSNITVGHSFAHSCGTRGGEEINQNDSS